MSKLFMPIATLAMATSAVASAQSTRVAVLLTSHKISPGPIHLPGGVPLRLTIANHSRETHDFTAPKFFAWSNVRSGPIPGGRITLRPGQRAHVTLTPRRGTYKVRCSRFAHALLGGSTTIVVL